MSSAASVTESDARHSGERRRNGRFALNQSSICAVPSTKEGTKRFVGGERDDVENPRPPPQRNGARYASQTGPKHLQVASRLVLRM